MWVAFTFHPTLVAELYGPPGIVASSTVPFMLSYTTMRAPLVSGSSGGLYGCGRTIEPLNLKRSSPGGVFSRPMVRFGLLMVTGTMLLHGSQAFPMPSPSSSC